MKTPHFIYGDNTTQMLDGVEGIFVKKRLSTQMLGRVEGIFVNKRSFNPPSLKIFTKLFSYFIFISRKIRKIYHTNDFIY